jgi:N-acetylmuramoyl-L-alanine amidase
VTQVRDAPSPNHDARPPGARVDILLLHYTGMMNGEAALARLADPAAKVSAHYLVEEDGRVFRLVDESRRAWHAGLSCWRGERDINARSIGIELVNPGHEFGYRGFPEAQMAALLKLAGDILGRHRIPSARVLGHADVAPTRRQDPGELFDWPRLAAAGIGLWPEAVAPLAGEVGPGSGPDEIARLQAALAAFGYCVRASGAYERDTEAAVAALQRHWRPARIDGRADGESRARLAWLLDRADAKA